MTDGFLFALGAIAAVAVVGSVICVICLAAEYVELWKRKP